MANQKLLDNVSKLGVPMMAPDEPLDVNKTLADVVKSHDTRLWENFPVLLASAAQKQPLDLKKVSEQLKKSVDKKALGDLVALSKAVHDYYHLPWTELNKSLDTFKKSASDLEKSFKPLRNALAHATNVHVALVSLSTDRLKRSFEDYLTRVKQDEQKEQVKYKGLSLDYALSQVFSPKQKELFQKKLKGEPLTKTEREYFSRAVKKKAQALANDELHALARQVVG
jgi:hypothetical protein